MCCVYDGSLYLSYGFFLIGSAGLTCSITGGVGVGFICSGIGGVGVGFV